MSDDGLKTLAIELVEEVETLSDSDESDGLDIIQLDSIACLSEGRKHRERQKLMSHSGMSSEDKQLDALRQAQEAARRPDMRRPGPR